MTDRETKSSVDAAALRAAGERADYYRTGDGPLWRAAADEVDRLRAVIAARQHDDLCAVWDLNGGTSDQGCTCWKAETL